MPVVKSEYTILLSNWITCWRSLKLAFSIINLAVDWRCALLKMLIQLRTWCVFELQGAACHMEHTVLVPTGHKRTHPTLTPVSKAGAWFTYPGGMEDWVDLDDLVTPRPGVKPTTILDWKSKPLTAVPPRCRYSHCCLGQYHDHRYNYRLSMV